MGAILGSLGLELQLHVPADDLCARRDEGTSIISPSQDDPLQSNLFLADREGSLPVLLDQGN